MTVINTVMGTLTAYVLVRYQFPGKIAAQQRDRPAAGHPHPGDRGDAGGALRTAAGAGGLAEGAVRLLDHLRPAGDHPGPAVYHLPLRGAGGPAGADRPGPSPGRCRHHAGRQGLDDLPAHHPAAADPAAGQRRAAQLCPGDRRVRRDRHRGRQHPFLLADRGGVCAGRGGVREPAGRQRRVDRDGGHCLELDPAGRLAAAAQPARRTSADASPQPAIAGGRCGSAAP